MSELQVEIRQAEDDEAQWLQTSFAAIGWSKPDGYFQICLDEQRDKCLVLLVAKQGSQYVGHCKILWESEYKPFLSNKIPEISDLNVLPQYRDKGIGTSLIEEAEAIVAPRSETIGIGVGMLTSYGAAQRLYVRLGYRPDGNGLTYQSKTVEYGKHYCADDDLVLWLTKSLKK